VCGMVYTLRASASPRATDTYKTLVSKIKKLLFQTGNSTILLDFA